MPLTTPSPCVPRHCLPTATVSYAPHSTTCRASLLHHAPRCPPLAFSSAGCKLPCCSMSVRPPGLQAPLPLKAALCCIAMPYGAGAGAGRGSQREREPGSSSWSNGVGAARGLQLNLLRAVYSTWATSATPMSSEILA